MKAVPIRGWSYTLKSWKNMTQHLDKVSAYSESYTPLEAINEELKKYGAIYDPVLVELVFPEEKGYTLWLLRWG